MELTADWRRQATKAAGVTALAPAVLLGSAVLLAAGAGFGGLSSLGQIAGGPTVPAVEQVAPLAAKGASRANDPVVALAPTPDASRASGASRAAPSSRGSGTGSDERQVRSVTPGADPQSPVSDTPTSNNQPRTPSPSAPQTGSTPGNTPSQTAPVTPQTPSTPQAPRVPSVPAPVEQLLDIPKSLPAPVGPLTGRLLDSVTGIAPLR